MKITSESLFIVTGGASGLGEATVRTIVNAGGKVLCFDMNDEQGEKLQNELNKSNVFFANVNVTEEDSVKQGIESGLKHFGSNIKLRGLVNCAGVGFASKVLGKNGEVYNLDTFNTVVQINLIGTFNVLRLAVPYMAKAGQTDESNGVIVNVASVAAFDGQIGQAAYRYEYNTYSKLYINICAYN